MKIISKFINKQFLDKYLRDAFYDNGILFQKFYCLGDEARRLKKYDDIYEVYFWDKGLYSAFEPSGMKHSIDNICEFYNLCEDYEEYIQTEDKKLFKSAMWFIICFNAFNQGYELKEFNIKTKRYTDIRAIIEWMLSSPRVFYEKFYSDFKKLITQLKKLENDLISFQKRYDKEDEEFKKYQKTDEYKKISREAEKASKIRFLKEEKVRHKEYVIEQEALKKKMGITTKGPINVQTLNKAQHKIWKEHLDEMLRIVNGWKDRV